MAMHVLAADTHGASESLPAYLNNVGEVPMGGTPDFALDGCAMRRHPYRWHAA